MVALVGPTAVGKTALSLRLARELHAEIVSVDSVQVYRGLDVGSAKPTAAERAEVPHHLIDVADPDEPFDAADFARRAAGVIRAVRARGRNVLLVGGTGLYLRALLRGLAPCPGRHPALRAQLRRAGERFGTAALHGWLRDVDPAAAARIAPNDLVRVIRALEVYALTRSPLSAHHARARGRPAALPYRIFGLIRPRQELDARIDRRVDQMIAEGLLDETRALLARGYRPDLGPLQSLGYRHMIRYLRGERNWEQAVAEMKRDTRRYARRQLTWFRGEPVWRWVHPDAAARAVSPWAYLSGGEGP
ncbi:tRNA (adenosine(37)-N6)-dimethylallyltransferase MiaA [Dissulfurirhabdus thermomarina]|nr:tRNA (adenosine(37)-N6)-dimethylallyltransferase MiaA [Dissulfurirhabdus thermomarina]NMX24212.1 tRNA (adenosine(37)-N6)-dimethylallyltransferase MiaA [Dissulfurirhabdus thermomarina]